MKQEPEAKLQLHVQTPPVSVDMKPANLLQSQQIPGGLQQVRSYLAQSAGPSVSTCVIPLRQQNFQSTLLPVLCVVSADSDGHAGPHHEDSTSGAESCRHASPARLCAATTPAHCRYGNHSHHQTRLAERPHQPAGGQQADQSELGARAAGIQECHGGKILRFPPHMQQHHHHRHRLPLI